MLQIGKIDFFTGREPDENPFEGLSMEKSEREKRVERDRERG